MATQKTDKTKILMTNGILMKVQSIAEAPAIPLTCIKRFRLENQFSVYLRVAFYTGFAVAVQCHHIAPHMQRIVIYNDYTSIGIKHKHSPGPEGDVKN